MKEQVMGLLQEKTMQIWDEMTAAIDALYDVDRLWDKGFGCWQVEYKYRRGGKTLCTFYAREGEAVLLITYGKTEREKFDLIRDSVSEELQKIYDETKTLHDGKWLWIPLDDALKTEDMLAMLKIKRRPNRKQG
ncbi:MAG: DUF3788 family protein [Clostridia bacterium]|nr:DUF3788 family protein [Clostridia bacterium]